jgi:hypothetical protein
MKRRTDLGPRAHTRKATLFKVDMNRRRIRPLRPIH